MKKIFFVLPLLFPMMLFSKSNVVWTAVFSDIQPRTNKVTTEYCLAHSPTVMVTTVKQVLSKDGSKTINGLRVKYLSYKSKKKSGLLFNTVDALISGHDDTGSWSEPLKMYQQTLSEKDEGKTWVVWSTSKCKGSFIGIPTIV